MFNLFSFEFSHATFAIFCLVAFLIGMAKAGVHGAGMLAVPLLASVFGGQYSSGLMLPLLCLADIAGVLYYHRHASWQHLKKLFPWAIPGILAGTVVGEYIDDRIFKIIMAIIVIISVGIMIWLEKERNRQVPDHYWFAALTGFAGGFTSMIGNLAGSVMAVYFLSMRLPKNEFIGTTAWFFMVINWFKIPFHVIAWDTINLNTLLLDVAALPIIIVGAVAGILIVKRFKDRGYRWFIIGMTLVAAVMMVIS